MHTTGELRLVSNVEPGPEELVFETADGVHSPGGFRTAELLLAEVVEPEPDERVLVVDGNYGVLATAMGTLARATATEGNARRATLCRRNAERNGADVDVELVADVAELNRPFDRAVYAPYPYDPVRVARWKLADALALVRPAGTVHLAAAPEDGGTRLVDAAAEWGGDPERVTRSEGVRVHRVHRPAEFASPAPPPAERYREVSDALLGEERTFVTRPGLFSPDGVDRGTRLLAETVAREATLDGARLLDIACGYGALGTALGGAATTLSLTDASRPATACAERTVRRAGLRASVHTADAADGVTGPFDLVVMNPPTHAGRGVTDDLFRGARSVLATDGRLWLVYNETLAYEDSLPFSAVEVVRREAGYTVARARG